jgi:hypothetical protein
MREFIRQGQHQLDSLELRVTDFTLREDYLRAARSCLDQARDVLKMSESKDTTATQQHQALLAAETMLAVCNRQIRLLLVNLLDIYGPGVLSLTSVTGLPKSSP